MALVTEQALFLLDVCKLIEFATSKGYTVTGGELFRTPEQQKIYVDTGKSKTMDSNHMRRLAIDLNIFEGGVLCGFERIKPLGDYWQSLGELNRWGGYFKGLVDTPHFERNIQG